MNKYVGSDFDELQLEREAHRKTWRQLEQVQRENAALKKLPDRANERMDELKSGGLPQQEDSSAIPPAQDERMAALEDLLHRDWMLSAFDRYEGRDFEYVEELERHLLSESIATRPAQPEQNNES